MNQKVVLSSMAMDVKRVALGLHRGSYKMAETFLREVRKRRAEVDKELPDPYLRRLLAKIDRWITEEDAAKKSEDALMYSTLLQNYVQKKLA